MAKNKRAPGQAAGAGNKAVPDVSAILKQALALHQAGRLKEAELLYQQVLKSQPRNFDALHLHGVLALQSGKLEQGVKLISQAIKINPGVALLHNNLGNALMDLKRPEKALASYRKALSLKPDFTSAYNNRGTALLELGRPEAALADYDKVIELDPGYVEAHNNRGNALVGLRRFEEALLSFDRALSLKPNHADSLVNRGNALKALERLDEALASYDKAIAVQPKQAKAHFNRANTLLAQGRAEQALAGYDNALSINADYVEAHNNRGNALAALGRQEEALQSYARALKLRPNYPEAINNQGNALMELRRQTEALDKFKRALKLKADYADAQNNLGNACKALSRREEAVGAYRKAVSLRPDCAEYHNSLGNGFNDLKQTKEALASYERAIALKPGYADALVNLGNLLLDLKRLEEANDCIAKAYASAPELPYLLGTYLHTRMKLCDWAGLQGLLRQLEAAIEARTQAATPFSVLGLLDAPQLHKTVASVYAESNFPGLKQPIRFPPGAVKEKIRLGYYSADYHNHATTYLMAELFEAHDKDRFELIGFSFGPDKDDEMRRRVASAFDEFIDVRGLSDRQVAELSREKEIDIAVDLKGYTQNARPGIFAESCAPLQVSYLGYPGTMGAGYFDYVIADRTLVPESHQADFSEKPVYLPHSYQVNDSTRRISERVFSRQELGLPESGFVYCCFNNNYKILPRTFDTWMNILKAVPGSVLWLLESNPTAKRNLQLAAGERGVEQDRLVFADHLPLDEHLARHRLADLFLDTLPYNAHTTASDALWAGLPLLTEAGQSFAARVSASLLNAISLPELVTESPQAYQAKAIELAGNPQLLREIRDKLARNRESGPLFNGGLFARHLEAAYEAMQQRRQAGLAPEVIEVPA